VNSGIDAIMTAHIAVTGIEGDSAPPATLSRYFLTDVLRNELRFRGLLFTDAMNMGAVINRYGEGDALLRAVDAGADVLLMPRDVPRAIETIVNAVNNGRVSTARLDASVRRILAAKAQAGLAQSKLVDLNVVSERVGVRAHTELARTIAQRSITLARDVNSAVPLAPAGQRVLSITYAGMNDPFAGSEFNRQLQMAGHIVVPARVDARTTATELTLLQALADSAQTVLVSLYVSPLEGSGSVAASGAFPELLQKLVTIAKPMVLLSFGSPYVVAAAPDAPAYLLAWGGGEVGQRAAARALLGAAPITGTLPITIPPYAARGSGLTRQPRTH
jgi:beta-N-acetylhexosaminidase